MPIQEQLPKSRITLTYRTNITGKEEDVQLPFRVLVLGDFSQGTSTDRLKPKKDDSGNPVLDANNKPVMVDKDLEERGLRSITATNLDNVMKDMNMTLKLDGDFSDADKVGGDGQGTIDVTLPITGMKSFHPDEIVKHVPKLKALVLMRKLLVEMQADIDNKKPVRQKLYDLYANPTKRNELIDGDQAALKAFQTLRLPASGGQPADPVKKATDNASAAATNATQAATNATKPSGDVAKTAADTAKTAADTAKTAAETAKTAVAAKAATANDAVTKANTAVEQANAAVAKANDAVAKAGADAKTLADAAKTAADAAKTAADAAKTAADAAKTP